jgi:hypothetical protein
MIYLVIWGDIGEIAVFRADGLAASDRETVCAFTVLLCAVCPYFIYFFYIPKIFNIPSCTLIISSDVISPIFSTRHS